MDKKEKEFERAMKNTYSLGNVFEQGQEREGE